MKHLREAMKETNIIFNSIFWKKNLTIPFRTIIEMEGIEREKRELPFKGIL